jgi:hypothetical protein
LKDEIRGDGEVDELDGNIEVYGNGREGGKVNVGCKARD